MNNYVKQCTSCKVSYPATSEYFHSNKQGKYGLRSKCKRCYCITVSKWQKNNRRKVNDATSRYHKSNPDKVKVWSKKAYKKYYASDKGKELWRKLGDARRSRKKLSEGHHSPKDISKQYNKQHGYCFWCSSVLNNKYHVDHIIPLSRFGTDWAANLVISCPFCNDSKGNKLPFQEWMPKKCLGR